MWVDIKRLRLKDKDFKARLNLNETELNDTLRRLKSSGNVTRWSGMSKVGIWGFVDAYLKVCPCTVDSFYEVINRINFLISVHNLKEG